MKNIGHCGTYRPCGVPVVCEKYSTSSTAQVIAVSFHVIEKTWKAFEKSCVSLHVQGEVSVQLKWPFTPLPPVYAPQTNTQ
jgi:hypothetical protein